MHNQTLWRRIAPPLLAALLLTAALLPGLAHHATAAGPIYRAGQVVVEMDLTTGTTIDAINATYGTTTIETLTSGTEIYLLRLPAGQDPQQKAAAMATDPRLLFAEPNFISQAPEANPSRIGAWGGLDSAPFFSQYAVAMLGLDRAHTFSSGSGKVVAVIDTGVQLTHPALASSLTAARFDFVDNDTTPDDRPNSIDDDGDGLLDEAAGHGTHVAGIIHLVAPASKIMPVRALDSDGNGDLFSVAKAINYAIDMGANVINLSLGTTAKSSLLNAVIRPATRRGIVVVAAAGNLSADIDQYPASDDCALSITSVGSNDIKSSFASYGGRVDFAAPGETIYSTFPTNGYARWSGTSMAAPFVAGQAALLLSRVSTLTVRQVAGIIQSTARPLDQLNRTFSGKLGDGRVDIGASLAFLAAGNAPDARHGRISGGCIE